MLCQYCLALCGEPSINRTSEDFRAHSEVRQALTPSSERQNMVLHISERCRLLGQEAGVAYVSHNAILECY